MVLVVLRRVALALYKSHLPLEFFGGFLKKSSGSSFEGSSNLGNTTILVGCGRGVHETMELPLGKPRRKITFTTWEKLPTAHFEAHFLLRLAS